MARYASLAERYRAAREAFTLALELGCTPKEAEAVLRKRRAADADRAACASLAAKQSARPAAISADDWSAPWMMRD